MHADVFALVDGGAEELRPDATYHWDNARRSDANRMIVQRTLAGSAFFEDARGRRLVPAGWAMLFTHREPSRYGVPAGATEPYRLRYLSFSPGTSIIGVFQQVRADFGSVVRMAADGEAGALFEEIFQRMQTRSFSDRYQESELIYRMFIALYREQVHGTRDEDPIEFGSHLLRARFRSAINLKTVARQCGVTREHFIRAFGERFGETPGAMLRRLRLEHARSMLEATELPVAEVARASGFASATAFCRAYRSAFGTTPAHSRRPRR
jgi:AraC-like DNA-binding protein